jgi:hypothetical protein
VSVLSDIPRVCGGVVFTCVSTLAFAAPQARAAVGWRPVTPEELSLRAPKVQADADAEALFYEIEAEDERQHDRSIRRHYIRIKAFTEEGARDLSQVDLVYDQRSHVMDIEARTIQPDGTVLEATKAGVRERVLVRARGKKLRATSLALPGVKPGVIVEYRWTEIRNGIRQFTDILVQREVPIQRLRVALRPWESDWSAYRLRVRGFHVGLTPLVEEQAVDGRVYMVTTAANLPAYKEEPDMPPEGAVRAWLQLYYLTDVKETAEHFWRSYGQELQVAIGSRLKPNATLRDAVPAIVGDAATPTERAGRICEFCRTQIRRLEDDASGLTADELARAKTDLSPVETLAQRAGRDRDILSLFGALAAAAGLDVRYVALPDRSETIFLPQFITPQLLTDRAIGVRLEKNWGFYDPSEPYLDCGRLRWQNEGVTALVLDSKAPELVQTPLAPAEYSRVERVAHLRLSDDGTLEGDVRVTYGGHLGAAQKETYDSETTARREELLRDRVKARLSQAEVDGIELQSASDPLKPLTLKYHVRVPSYAQRTGKRLLLQPSFFRYGIGARYTASTRVHDIAFDYPWSELDTVAIELPVGYELDHAETPAPVVVPPTLDCTVRIGVTAGDAPVLHLERRFKFGTGAGMTFAQAGYANLKSIFEGISELDSHVIALRQKTADK